MNIGISAKNAFNIFVTGANGFVGHALCEQANSLGYQVRAATRKPHQFSGTIENVLIPSLGRISNQDATSNSSNNSNCDGDDSDALRHALTGVDVVIHLAARVHVMKESTVNNATQILEAYRTINVEGTLMLARAAASAGVRRFIYLSSIKVNGESTRQGHPFTAEDEPAPEDPYGVSKLEAELALMELARLTGMELVIIRPPLVYGPRVGANFAAMMKILSYQIPLPFGAIKNVRSMVGLDNLVSLILTCVKNPNAAGQVFLAGDGESVSLTGLLRKLIFLMGVRTLLIPVPSKLLGGVAKALGKGGVAKRLFESLEVDIRKTRELLNWTPPLTLDQGLKKTVEWYLKK